MTLISNGRNSTSHTLSIRCGVRNTLLVIIPCILFTITIGVLLYEIAWMYYLPGLLMIHDTETITITLPHPNNYNDGSTIIQTKTVTRRRPDLLYKYDPNSGKKIPNTHIDGIMEGILTLIDIQIPDMVDIIPTIAEDEVSEQMYSGITATFCHISWELQNDHNQQHHTLSTFRDIQKASVLCPGTKVTVDLWDIVQQIRQYDIQTTTSNSNKSPVNVIPQPTAVIFHESKSGGTVISNALSAFAIPHHTRVYSEASPPLTAIQACEMDTSATPRRCTKESHIKLIQDIFYVMGRVSRTITKVRHNEQQQYVFYKLQSTGVQSIDAFVQAMPTTPWIFAYRNSIEVMMSHFSQYIQPTSDYSIFTSSLFSSSNENTECLQNYGKPESLQPPIVLDLVLKVNKKISQLTQEEYCAAHIAGLATAALREHDRTIKSAININTHAISPIRPNNNDNNNGIIEPQHHSIAAPPHFFINYNTLPHILWESILPSLIVHPITKQDIDNMHNVASVKIQKHDSTIKSTTITGVADIGKHEHWTEDSTLKQGMAPKSVRDAVKLFLDPVYEQMELVRQATGSN